MRLRTQDIIVECLVSLHVRQFNTQKILNSPGDGVKFNHIRACADRFFKSPKTVLRVIGESYGNVGHYSGVALRQVLTRSSYSLAFNISMPIILILTTMPAILRLALS